jgi:hypothetical protein
MKDPTDPSYEEEEEEEEEEDEAEEEEVVPTVDLINEDLDPEERQEEFLNMMKQRFVDGKDPEYGNVLVALLCLKINKIMNPSHLLVIQ